MPLNAFATVRCTEAVTERLRCEFCITSYDLQTVNGGSKQTVFYYNICDTQHSHVTEHFAASRSTKTRFCYTHGLTHANGFCSKILFYTPPVLPLLFQHCLTPVLPVQCCSGSLFLSICHCNICVACTAGVICLGKPQETFTDFIITIVICYHHR